ncbi:MAG: pyridoxal 5'-phosphate synthase glutaminase subunit PdxT [SAR202 cluster bacterium]|nr:pyridoxal 5'-phosphate synthase glutaminase subunit PdxT [SAR202 cluster bacterium]
MVATGGSRIGVLALQGDFAEHLAALRSIGIEGEEVRKVSQLEGLDGLIIPGGESTAITKLMDAYSFRAALPRAVADGLAVWGTCAGMIVMARSLTDPYPKPLGLLDIKVSRNWFGRQVDSFESDFKFKGIRGKPIRAVFIRAPVVEEIGDGVEELAVLPDGHAVAVRSGRLMATAFHPELTDDRRVHRYFADLAAAKDGKTRD